MKHESYGNGVRFARIRRIIGDLAGKMESWKTGRRKKPCKAWSEQGGL